MRNPMSRKIGEIWGTQFLLPYGAVIRIADRLHVSSKVRSVCSCYVDCSSAEGLPFVEHDHGVTAGRRMQGHSECS
jgi:hypothetical protein